MNDLNKMSIIKDIQLYNVKTTKFKSNQISLFFKRRLSKDEATKNTLLPMIMKRSSSMFPKTEDISKYLEENFGTEFSADIIKKGEYQLIVFSVNLINENYIQNKVPVLENILNFLIDIVFNQKSFNQDYFNQEKKNLELYIKALKNDKKSYAKLRCIEEMCKGEPYSVCEIGDLEELEKITCDSLFEHYKNVLMTSKFDVFVVGDCDLNLVSQKISEVVSKLNFKEYPEEKIEIYKDVPEIKNVTEEDDIVQGKLCIGCRTNIGPESNLYFPLIIYNTLFGGGAYSKLFNNVREKLSLAYYVFSMFDRLKGVMTINAGIEDKKFQMAYDEILNQQKMVKENQFTDKELETAKLSAINAIKSQSDSASSTEDFYYSSIMAGRSESISKFVDQLSKVERNQVLEVANKIQLDTVFLLKSKKGDK